MYPSAFDYSAPRTLDEALAILGEAGAEGRVLAGGQSLIPMMKLGLAAPGHLIDINGLSELSYIRESNGHLAIGALARHADAAASDLLKSANGTMAAAAPWISDPLVRNRGTLCGSVAHCDPEGDWNSVMLAVGASVVVRSAARKRRDRERVIPISDFLTGPFTNSLRPGELVAEVRVPKHRNASGGAYLKLERKIGDYATVAVAAHLELGPDGRIAAAGVALTSVAPINLKVTEAEALLVGSQPGPEPFAEAAELAAAAADPRDDVRGTARWKRQVVRAFTRRALASAADQALKG